MRIRLLNWWQKKWQRYFLLQRIRLPQTKIILEDLLRWNNSKAAVSLRISVLIIFFLSCYFILTIRVIELALVDEEGLYTRSFYGYNKFIENRNEVVDRNNNLLAVNLSTASLFANPQKMVDVDEAVDKICKILPDLDRKKLNADLRSDKNFVWVKRDLTPKEQFRIHNLGIAGFDFKQEQKRVYTYANLTSHILGFVGRDEKGLSGIESYFDKRLKNQDLLSDYKSQNAPLVLSVDLRVQNIVHEELENVMETFSAIGGVGIVADVDTGEIISMVSKPDYNPHFPGKVSKDKLFNKASLGTYELGSVFKALTMAIGFDSNTISLHDLYNISAPIKIAEYRIKDFHRKKGWKTVSEIFMYSSNVGTVQIALDVGKDKFRQYIKNLGLLDKVDIELPERSMPMFPRERAWGDLSTATISYGHGMSISPLHLVQATIPAVNGGMLHPLTLLRQEPGKLDKAPRRVFKDETSFQLNKLLRLAVAKGTARRAEVKGYLPGGKTGTANKAVGGKYDKKLRYSSFIGAFPMTKPKYVIFVMVDEPKGIKSTFGFATAGFTAAPVAGKIISRMGTVYGINPINDADKAVQEILHIDYTVDESV